LLLAPKFAKARFNLGVILGTVAKLQEGLAALNRRANFSIPSSGLSRRSSSSAPPRRTVRQTGQPQPL
jgi:hypothetical protein